MGLVYSRTPKPIHRCESKSYVLKADLHLLGWTLSLSGRNDFSVNGKIIMKPLINPRKFKLRSDRFQSLTLVSSIALFFCGLNSLTFGLLHKPQIIRKPLMVKQVLLRLYLRNCTSPSIIYSRFASMTEVVRWRFDCRVLRDCSYRRTLSKWRCQPHWENLRLYLSL